MPKLVSPAVYIIADSRLDDQGLAMALAALGVPNWVPAYASEEPISDAEHLTEFCGKLCYMSFALDLNRNLTAVGMRSNFQYIQEGLVSTGHLSVLEHSTVTFLFKDVSRVFTHELVRHRVGSAYSQVSGRYVRTDQLTYWLPAVVRGGMAETYFHKAFAQMEQWVATLEAAFQINDLKDFGLKKKLTSAFRRLIGNGAGNHIVATFNHRTIRHLLELRTSRHAEEEIRVVFNLVWSLVSSRYPAIYADGVTVDVDGWLEVTFPQKAEVTK